MLTKNPKERQGKVEHVPVQAFPVLVRLTCKSY